jgi:predicted DNA-binding protein
MWRHVPVAMNLRLTPEEQQLLDALAADCGMSKAAVMRRALVEKAVRDGQRVQVEESPDWARNRSDDLLRRLGSA